MTDRNTDKPSFKDRNSTDRTSKYNGERRNDRGGKPNFNRDDRRDNNRGDRPSFNRDNRRDDRRDDRGGKPNFNRNDRRDNNRGDRPSFNRDNRRDDRRDDRGGKPNFNRNDRRDNNRGDRPSFNRDNRRDDRRDDRGGKPNFNRNDRRDNNRGDRPSFNRDNRRDDRRDDRGGKPNFNRDDRRENNRGDRDGGNFRGRKQFTGGGRGGDDRQQIVSARRGAFYLLEAVLVDKRPLEFTEHSVLKQVSPRDRGLTRMIAYTALRHNTLLDALIDHFVDDEIGTPQVRVFLKVGMTQILFMETPEHAALNETLNAVFGKSEPSKGMMNAILRRTITEGQAWIDGHTDLVTVPKFLWRSWVGAYGEKTSRLISSAHLTIAPIDISVKSNPEMWAEKLDGMVLPSGGVRIGNPGKITDLEGYDTGDWWVQDFAAQIPVTLFGDDLTGKTIIDMCAAPGGKTAQLLARGAKVIAVDHNEFRLQRLHENMERLGLTENLEVVVSDAVKYKCDALVDGVLLDAPCSATGTIRKHPDLPFLKDAELIKSVSKLQTHMLSKAGDFLKPGGTLVFATCSIQPEEGEHHLLSLPENLKRNAIRRREVEGMHTILTPKGVIRTLPHMFSEDGGMDGFFVARFEKV